MAEGLRSRSAGVPVALRYSKRSFDPIIRRLCAPCLETHQERIERFGKARPSATADDWFRYLDNDADWQARRIKEHCLKAARSCAAALAMVSGAP